MVNLSRCPCWQQTEPSVQLPCNDGSERRQHAPLWGSKPSLTQCWSPFLTWLDWFIWSIGHPSHFFISTTETHIRALHGFFHLVWSKRARSLISQTKATMTSPEQRSIQEGSSQGGWCLVGCLSGHFQAQRRQILCPFPLQASRSLLLPAAMRCKGAQCRRVAGVTANCFLLGAETATVVSAWGRNLACFLPLLSA